MSTRASTATLALWVVMGITALVAFIYLLIFAATKAGQARAERAKQIEEAEAASLVTSSHVLRAPSYDVHLMKDNATGVEYFVVRDAYGLAVFPRLSSTTALKLP